MMNFMQNVPKKRINSNSKFSDSKLMELSQKEINALSPEKLNNVIKRLTRIYFGSNLDLTAKEQLNKACASLKERMN